MDCGDHDRDKDDGIRPKILFESLAQREREKGHDGRDEHHDSGLNR